MNIFLTVSLGIIAASIFGFLARLAKQPPIVGYLFAGLALALLGVFTQAQAPLLQTMAQLGITLLLFLVGLEMNVKELAIIGRVVVLGGLGQIGFTTLVGYILATLLGFSTIEAMYIAICLTFSSTIVIVKLLSEKRDLDSLYGKIAVGLLLVQDLAAILLLVFLSGFQTSSFQVLTFFWVLVKGLLLLFAVYILAKFVLPKLFDKIATLSNELLFVSSVAWVLAVASFVSLPRVGFSPEIGGLLAGIALANSAEHLQIASRVKPLRDFFVTIFFLLLGTKMAIDITPQIVLPAVVFSLFVLLGGPLVVLALLGILGHKKRTSFLVAITFAQVSEFSLILIALGERLGHVSSSIVGLITLIAVITMASSTYLIMNSYFLFQRLSSWLSLFERKKVRESALSINKLFTNHVVLLGCDRVGKRILPTLGKKGLEVIIVDFNPLVVESLVADGYSAFYGDASDAETLESLNLSEAKMIISTTRSLEDNLIVLGALKKFEHKPLSIFTADNAVEALSLYEAGADYVVVPQFAGGDHLAHLIWSQGFNREHFKSLKARHFDRLARERF